MRIFLLRWTLAVCLAVPHAVSGQTESGDLRDSIADLPGVRIAYIDSGGFGEPVVFLHAATGNRYAFEHQIRAFVEAGFRFIAYDRKGWGNSLAIENSPPGTGADDLNALVDELGLGRIHLLGTAAGAMVAIDYALSYPERLESLIIANTIGGVADEEFQDLGRRIRPSPQFEELPPDFKELGPEYRAANPDGTARWLQLEKNSRQPDTPPFYQGRRNLVTLESLENISVPTLFIAGGADLYAPPAVMRMLADRVSGALFFVVPNVGHSTFWEAPDIFSQIVLEFLRTQ